MIIVRTEDLILGIGPSLCNNDNDTGLGMRCRLGMIPAIMLNVCSIFVKMIINDGNCNYSPRDYQYPRPGLTSLTRSTGQSESGLPFGIFLHFYQGPGVE